MASKHYHFKFNFDHDREIIDRIESKENKNDYIRGLVLSDIAADILRDSIKLEDQDQDQDQEQEQEQEQDQYIDTDIVYQERINWFNEHCPALNNLDTSINHCDGCEYNVHYTDVDGIKKTACCLEDEWRKHWSHVLYNAVGGADRDYPAEFKGLKKAKTHLNSLYGKSVSNASNASNALKEDTCDG